MGHTSFSKGNAWSGGALSQGGVQGGGAATEGCDVEDRAFGDVLHGGDGPTPAVLLPWVM